MFTPTFRDQVDRRPHPRVDEHYAGGLPPKYGTAPHVRAGRGKWFNLLWLIPIGFVLLVVGVAVAKGLRNTPAVESFLSRYPGTSPRPAGTPTGFPPWLNWQHLLNLFFMVFIIRAGITVLADHPRLYLTRNSTPGKEWFRIARPVPDDPEYTAKADSITLPDGFGLPGRRHSIGLARWWHLGLDTLWLLNGVVFFVLLFSTGQWKRLVPASWDVFPNALSVAIQYLSLDWPLDNGWVNYNSLQLLTYFVTVFLAAPAAVLSGLGMSPALSTRFPAVSSVLSIQLARSLHFLVMCWFVLFIVVHVTFVLTTGALRNLNHMFAANDSATSWVGFGFFSAALLVLVVAWVAATPFTYRHPRAVQRAGFALIGPAQRLFEHLDAKPGRYTEKDISPFFWPNGTLPAGDEYHALRQGQFRDYRLQVYGQVDNPVELSLEQLRALPHHEQITQHFCIQGWSGVAKWGGVSMRTILDLVRPRPQAKWVIFYSYAEGADGGVYYDAQAIDQMSYHLTMLAMDMNGEPLTCRHGAPLRLRNEAELGFKMVKWIKGIEFVEDFRSVGGGQGGYTNDHEYYGYRQSI